MIEASSMITLQSLVDNVEKAVKGIKDASFEFSSTTQLNSKEYGGANVETIRIPFVKGDNSPGVNSYEKLDAVIDKLFREYRNDGLIFTQPKSVDMATNYTGLKTGVLEFTIGIPNSWKGEHMLPFLFHKQMAS